ncbi:MAG: ArsA-related P-loop ATPase, partial [Acidimicrobiia bacterium]
RIMGTQFLEDIVDFFTSISVLYEGFLDRARAVEHLLHDRRTTFLIVTTLEESPVREAERFLAELAARDLQVGALVYNKVLPDELLSVEGDEAARALVRDPGVLAAKLAGLEISDLADAALDSRLLATIAESFLNFEVVAKREADLRAQLSGQPELTVRVPCFEADIHDLEGIARASSWLFRTT